MPDTKIAQLPDRGVVAVTGPDAAKLLQGLITNDIDKLSSAPALYAGLLTPQGKILYAFFVVKVGDGFLLETELSKTADLVKRLMFYKLRAAAKIEDVSQKWATLAAWTAPIADARALVIADTRSAALGWRALLPAEAAGEIAAGDPAAYHAHRIALGVPEPERDYPLGDTFPHEADFDIFHGADFDKGCFVGQEVVARMQHKSVVRKRVVRVSASTPLPADHPVITTGKAEIGRLGSVDGVRGLALLRLDRVAEAMEKGEEIYAGGTVLTVDETAIADYRKAAAVKPGAAP